MSRKNVLLVLFVLSGPASVFGQTAISGSSQANPFSIFDNPVFRLMPATWPSHSKSNLEAGGFLFTLDSTVNIYTFPPDAWRPDGKSGSKEEFTYTAENRLASNLYFDWNSMESRWVGSYGSSYTYDDRGNIIRSSDLAWKSGTGRWSPVARHDITFNEAGNKTSLYSVVWDTITKSWIGDHNEEYTYDSNQNRLSETYSARFPGQTEWDRQLIEYHYNVDGQTIEILAKIWDPATSAWIPTMKFEPSYTQEGLLLQYNQYVWSTTGLEWELTGKWDFLYNSDGQITHEYRWERGVPASPQGYSSHRQYTYTNNAEGRKVSQVNYKWVSNPGQMKEQSRYLREYDLVDNLISYTLTDRNTTTSAINDGTWYTYAYDSRKNLLQTFQYYWNRESLSFKPYYRQENTYDDRNNRITKTSAFYDQMGSKWGPFYKSVYSFDLSVSATDIANPYCDSLREGMYENIYWDQFKRSKPDSINNYIKDSDTDDWKLTTSVTSFHYSSLTSTKPIKTDPESFSVQVYPNPARSNIRVVVPEEPGICLYQILDLQGKVMIRGVLDPSGNVDVGSFARGAYLLSVENHKGMQSVKRILIH